MIRLRLFQFWTVLLCICASAQAQTARQVVTTGETPSLSNGSFEDIARPSAPPRGWTDCGFPNESAPDVQPSGAWEVYRPAYHGYTYLGMVTRENDTWESVGQKLSTSLMAGQCYQFSIWLCSSSEYWSAVVPDSIKNREVAATLPEKNFNQAIKLRIWGGAGYCDKRELLAESRTVTNTNWEKYTWKIKPTRNLSHIVFEAFYKTPTLFPYNGNILLDHASDFVQIPCSEQEELVIAPAVNITQPIEKVNPRQNQVRVNAVVRNIKYRDQISFYVNGTRIDVFDFDPSSAQFSTLLYLKEGKNAIHLSAKNAAGEAEDETSVYIIEQGRQQEEDVVLEEPAPEPTENVVAAPAEKPYKILKSLNNRTVKTGEIIQVERLYFQADSFNLSRDSTYEVLDEVFAFLAANPGVTIEVGGHTSGGKGSTSAALTINTRYSDNLSRARAKTVATYLVNKGIKASRIQYKGYGSRKPIASNDTAAGRRQNQRVELKILSTS